MIFWLTLTALTLPLCLLLLSQALGEAQHRAATARLSRTVAPLRRRDR